MSFSLFKMGWKTLGKRAAYGWEVVVPSLILWKNDSQVAGESGGLPWSASPNPTAAAKLSGLPLTQRDMPEIDNGGE